MTALIASLLREQRAAEDRQMFDAWSNGGKVQGKAVTDERLLAYIKSRRDGFSTDDPLYDEWNNRLTQYGFSIGEQKIGLKYKQGKVGAGAVAAFYRDQLKSIPKNSAFYREVAGRAAQFSKAVGSAARGAARGRATAGLRDKLNTQLIMQQDNLALERLGQGHRAGAEPHEVETLRGTVHVPGALIHARRQHPLLDRRQPPARHRTGVVKDFHALDVSRGGGIGVDADEQISGQTVGEERPRRKVQRSVLAASPEHLMACLQGGFQKVRQAQGEGLLFEPERADAHRTGIAAAMDRHHPLPDRGPALDRRDVDLVLPRGVAVEGDPPAVGRENAAIVSGIESEVGTLETGKFADLLIISGNPLEDLNNLQDI